MKIWEQRPDEKAEDYDFFKIYLELEPKRSLKKVAEITGQGKDKFKKLSAKFDWQSRVKAYDADKTEGVVDSAPADRKKPADENATADNVKDWEVATSHSRLLALNATPVQNDSVTAIENTGGTFNLTTETLQPKNAASGAFEAPQVPPPQDSTTLLPVADLPAPSRTLDQLADDFNLKIAKGDSRVKEGLFFYIDAGKTLLTAKKLVKHGDWESWLKSKSQYPIRRAQKLMQLADRFGFLTDTAEFVERVSLTQMLELLALPAGEEQDFLDKLTVEGKELVGMSKQELREEVKAHNAEIERLQQEKEAEKERADKLQGRLDLFVDKLATAKTDIDRFKKDRDDQLTKKQQAEKNFRDAQKVIDQKSFENESLQKKIQELENKPPVTVEFTRDVIPPDYEKTKKALADSQEQISKLQEQITAAPADTESLKSEIAQLKSTQADAAKRAEAFAKINTAADIIATVDKNFIQDFAREYPDKFKAICSLFATAD